jgi:outer membrane lipoprotein SlyB
VQLNTSNRLVHIAGCALLFSGCATPAPEIPYSPSPTYAKSNATEAINPGQKLIKVSKQAWEGLADDERNLIKQNYSVTVLSLDSFGIIIDSQSANESTSGTSTGANLGAAVGNAAYVDRAIQGGSYSAKTQLATQILGAIVGSSLDSKPTSQYHFRYTVKLADGDIRYFDEYRTTPFKHSIGVCISVPEIALVGQQVCSQTATTLRAKYIVDAIAPTVRK